MRSLFIAVLITVAGISAGAAVDNLNDVRLVGSQNCLLFFVETSANNAEIVIACDGKLMFKVASPPRKDLGLDAVNAIKAAYRQDYTNKCLEAGLNTQKTIESEQFWGIFCN